MLLSTSRNSRPGKNIASLIADTAISITDPGQKPVLGVISWRADTYH